MLLPEATDRDRRDSQLRALGALLDAHAACGVLIRDMPDGLLVRGRVPAERVDGGTVPLERLFESSELFTSALDDVKRRGYGARGGPLERDLRLVGRLVDLGGWTDISVLQDGDAWVVRHRERVSLLRDVTTLDRGRLLEIEAEAIAARRPESAELEAEPVGARRAAGA